MRTALDAATGQLDGALEEARAVPMLLLVHLEGLAALTEFVL